MEKEYVDDDEPRRVPLAKVDRFGFVRSEFNSADVIVKSRSALQYERQAYYNEKELLLCSIVCFLLFAEAGFLHLC